jgi:DNA replication protein DnaC
MTDLIRARVAQALTSLHLKTAKNVLDEHLREANERELSHLQFLDSLLGDELSARQESSISVRTKLARFPALKSLDSFEFDEQPSLDRRLINELQSLAFIERAENVVLLGPPGVGKTHIAIGLGVRALQAGRRVYFLSAQDLLDQIHIA